MAATNPTRRTESAAADGDSGAGMAHLTIVPENFDPDEHGRGDDRDD